jgi:hypothetical protein
MFLGLWSVIRDPDTKRRELYGKAGAFRFKPYGVEYRVLSNFWLHTPDRMEYVWHLVRGALGCRTEPDPLLQDIINSSNVSAAKEFFHGLVGSHGMV